MVLETPSIQKYFLEIKLCNPLSILHFRVGTQATIYCNQIHTTKYMSHDKHLCVHVTSIYINQQSGPQQCHTKVTLSSSEQN